MALPSLAQQKAAQLLLERQLIQSSLIEWAKFVVGKQDQTPAFHHLKMLEKLQLASEGKLTHSKTGLPVSKLIISMPPGAAKSRYSSLCFPTWFMQKRKGCRILACSATSDLATTFSRDCRNLIAEHGNILGYGLSNSLKNVEEWATDKDGLYKCAGVKSAIVGRRADLGLIDDYVANQEDADSEPERRKVWNWFLKDFWPRLKPGALVVIICTRWHEEDLVGCLTDEKNSYNSPISPSEWEHIKFPFFPEEEDALGRTPINMSLMGNVDFLGSPDLELKKNPNVESLVKSRLWSEWFNEEMALGIMRLPSRQRACQYQQRPAPEDGDYFKKEWLRGYTRDDLDALIKCKPQIYGAGDWAVSEAKGSDRTCLGGCALSSEGHIYILPDLFWKIAGPEEVTREFIAFLKRRNPLVFLSEGGHISKSWGPFLRQQMLEQKVYNYIEEITPSRDKETRAQSFRGFCSMQQVRFPLFASWWPDAERELLMFPGGKHDDFVDFCSLIGQLVIKMLKTAAPKGRIVQSDHFIPTGKWLKEEAQRNKHKTQFQDR